MKNFVNLRATLFIAISLMLGISIGYFLFLSKPLGVIISSLLLAIIIISVFFFTGRETKRLKALLFCVLVLFSAIGLISFTFRLKAFNTFEQNGRPVSVSGRVVEVSENLDYTSYVLTDLKFVGANSTSSRYKLKLVAYDSEGALDFSLGDIITFNDTIYNTPSVYNGKFSAYNIVNGIKYTANVSSSDITKVGFYRTVFERISSRVREVYNLSLDGEQKSVATALILGDTSEIEHNTLENFRASGVAHIFAVSGLHIGFLTSLLFFVFKRVKIPEWAKVLIITLVIFSYSGICGFSPSSLRACITCFVMLVSRALSLKYDALSSLSISAIILLLISPFNLFDVGFTLSYVTVFGILLLSKPISRALSFIKSQKIKNALSLVLSAWLSSTPLVAYYFNNFSLVGIVTNLVFVPIVSVLFTILFVLTFFAVIFGAETVFLFIPNILLKAVVFVFSLVDFRIFEFSAFRLNGAIYIYYLALVLASDFINYSLKTKIISVFVALVMSVACFFGVRAIHNKDYKVYFSGNKDYGVALFSENDDNVLVVLGKTSERAIYDIKSLLSVSCVDDLDALIVLSSVQIDFITAIYELAPFSTVYLDENVGVNLALVENYLGAQAYIMTPNDAYSVKDYTISTNGREGLKIARYKSRVLLFGDTTGELSYSGFSENIALAIAFTNHEGIYSYYSPIAILSFSENTTFKSAERLGVCKYILNK